MARTGVIRGVAAISVIQKLLYSDNHIQAIGIIHSEDALIKIHSELEDWAG